MPKATHTITGSSSSVWAKLTGKNTETIAVYGQADLNRRLAEARKHGAQVTVRPVSDR